MTIFDRLNEARVRFNKSELKKSGHNKYADYRYFELGDFLPTALEIFRELKLCPLISFADGQAVMRIYDAENPDGIHIMFQTPMADANLKGCHPVQNLGAMHTYLRRYLWVLALEITEHDALDSMNGSDRGFDAEALANEYLQIFGNCRDVSSLRHMLMEAKGKLKAYPEIVKQLQKSATELAETFDKPVQEKQ